jgi:uncharacterized membrane protein
MKLNYWIVAIIVIVFAMFAVGGALYGQLPAIMASHWNAAGDVNGTMSKFWGVFFLPLLSLAITALLLVIPNIDPLKTNIQKFKNYYYAFIIVFLVYFFYIYMLTLLSNLNVAFDMTRMLMPAMGVFFAVIGFMMLKAKRNFFIGIRTPWTLSSDEVWDKTHKLGGKLFIAAGVITAAFGFLTGEIAIWVMLGLILGVAVFTTVYSYIIFHKLEKEGKVTLSSPFLKK